MALNIRRGTLNIGAMLLAGACALACGDDDGPDKHGGGQREPRLRGYEHRHRRDDPHPFPELPFIRQREDQVHGTYVFMIGCIEPTCYTLGRTMMMIVVYVIILTYACYCISGRDTLTE